MRPFGQLGLAAHLARSSDIGRRYFVVNGFDGALTMLGLGISGLMGKPYVGKPLAVKMNTYAVPFLSDLPFVGKVFFDQSPFFYMAIVLALAAWFTLAYTELGIKIRSTGENPRATEAQANTPQQSVTSASTTGSIHVGGST